MAGRVTTRAAIDRAAQSPRAPPPARPRRCLLGSPATQTQKQSTLHSGVPGAFWSRFTSQITFLPLSCRRYAAPSRPESTAMCR